MDGAFGLGVYAWAPAPCAKRRLTGMPSQSQARYPGTFHGQWVDFSYLSHVSSSLTFLLKSVTFHALSIPCNPSPAIVVAISSFSFMFSRSILILGPRGWRLDRPLFLVFPSIFMRL